MSDENRPEIGESVEVAGSKVNYLTAGSGDPLVFVHGSGPGVTAYANWRLTIPDVAERFHVFAPDMVGFGYTERPDNVSYNVQTWADQVVGFMDALDISRASLVGNSFGGAIALRVATQHPDRVDRLALMGSMGVSFPITDALDAVWGYEPSKENMQKMLGLFAYSDELANDEQLAEVRYKASIEPGFQESFSSMFPAPRQQHVDAMTTPDDEIAKLEHETLILHGRDDKVIPLDTSLKLLQLINRSQLHVFGRCGHWIQIEHSKAFNKLIADFMAG